MRKILSYFLNLSWCSRQNLITNN